jgi:hypothetical protein
MAVRRSTISSSPVVEARRETKSPGRRAQSRGGIGAHCIVVGKKPTTVECEGTAKLPGGKVTLQTSSQFTKNEAPTTIAITGGTGTFRNARGYLVTKNNVDTFYIEP